MVLREEVQLDIGDLELAIAGEADPPGELPGGIENIHGILGNLPVFFAGRDIEADLVVMGSQTVERREAEGAEPGLAHGGALLLGKIVSAVPGGRNLQILLAPSPHADVKAGHRIRALEQRRAERHAMRQRAGVVVRAGVRRRLFRVEVVHVHVAQPLRHDVKGGGDELFVGDHPVQLGEGIQAFHRLLIARKGQGVDGGLLDFVFEAFGQVEFAGQDGAFEIEPGCGRLEPAQVPAADAKLGEGIVQFPLPLVAAALGFHRHEAGGKASVFGQEGSLVDVDRLHAIHRDGDAELAGGGVGDIRRVDDQGAAILRAIGDAQRAAGLAHHAGNQRQRVGDGGRTARHFLGELTRHGCSRRGALLHRAAFAFDFDLGSFQRGNQRDFERLREARREVEIALDRGEALLCNREVAFGGSQSGECGAAGWIGIDVERGRLAAFQLDTHGRYGQFALVDHRDFNFEAGLRWGGPCARSEAENEPRGKLPSGISPVVIPFTDIRIIGDV